ncbi:MAG TPA: FG-GAP-like repeat-containing protein [Phycisphaerales bacterium]|nr:FG-GAP-like repeat-containing protein [Phycisphaerales bacterium]
MVRTSIFTIFSLLCLLALDSGVNAALSVTGHTPSFATGPAPAGSKITIAFNQPVSAATVNTANIWAFGKMSGPVSGSLTLSNNNQTVTLTPSRHFFAGETVSVYLSHSLKASDDTSLRAAGYSFQFIVRVRPSFANFNFHNQLSTNIAGESSLPYGGIACDWNKDTWLDFAMVNEDSHDLRVYLNTGDHHGNFGPIVQPPPQIGAQASPSDSSDFNRDGNPDICVANLSGDSVSILLGNGNGTFQPQQQITVGDGPAGIAVLDVDGDGDTDIAVANNNSNNYTILRNNGSGVFSVLSTQDAGVDGERSLGAADMNEDGILDLVIGGIGSSNMRVLQGNGDGTFTQRPAVTCGGATWKLALGDVNGDGHIDVTSANVSPENGAVLFGNGNGTLNSATTYTLSNYPLSTALLDWDGDGDLDWIVSCYKGDWVLYENNGGGEFSDIGSIPPPSAASCAFGFDIDNDGDLDLGLVDEVADAFVIYKNGTSRCRADIAPGIEGDGRVDIDDLTTVILNWNTSNAIADVDDSGSVNIDDLTQLILSWGPCN